MTIPRRRGRPPRADRSELDTRALLIRHGLELLTAQSLPATGLDAVLSRAGVPKGSFYHYFSSKAEFGQAVLAAYADYYARKLERTLERSTLPPLQRLGAFADDAAEAMARHRFERGCLVGNLAQDVGLLPEDYRAQLSAILGDWERRLADCLALARADGALPADTDCAAWARLFWIGWEGAVMRARLERSALALQQFVDGFLLALSAAPPPLAPRTPPHVQSPVDQQSR